MDLSQEGGELTPTHEGEAQRRRRQVRGADRRSLRGGLSTLLAPRFTSTTSQVVEMKVGGWGARLAPPTRGSALPAATSWRVRVYGGDGSCSLRGGSGPRCRRRGGDRRHRGARSGRRPGADAAQRGRGDDRRPDGGVTVDDAHGRVRAGREGGYVRQQLHQLAAVLPVAQHVLHGPIRPQPRRARQQRARRRLHEVQRLEHPAAVAAAGRLPHDPHRQVPERLRHRDQRSDLRAARLERVVRGPGGQHAVRL